MNLAVIPARGGSTRIPKKNIVDFFGQPMIAHTIAAAANSDIFSRVIVSTDDAEIAAISAEFGADVLERPHALGRNGVPVSEVVVHAIAELERRSEAFDSVCMLMANCPLRTSQDILDHFESFQQSKTSQISVVPFQGTYPQWALTSDSAGRAKWLFSDQITGVSQELPEAFCPTGAIWWSAIENLLRAKDFYGDGFRVKPLDFIRGWDIDDEYDLYVARVFASGMNRLPHEPAMTSESVDARI